MSTLFLDRRASCCPGRMVDWALSPFHSRSSWTLTPWRRAISQSVSPGRTVWDADAVVVAAERLDVAGWLRGSAAVAVRVAAGRADAPGPTRTTSLRPARTECGLRIPLRSWIARTLVP